jgi:hypothetical protein
MTRELYGYGTVDAIMRFYARAFLPRRRDMSFLAYFVVLVIAAGAALFGLDVLTAPLPERKPVTPMISATSAPNKEAKRVADQAKHDVAANKVLTPVYPANPGGVREVSADKPAAAETSGTAPAEERVEVPVPPQKAEVPKTEVAAVQAQTVPAPLPAPSAHPVAQTASAQAVPVPAPQPPLGDRPATQTASAQSAAHCDVQACSSAYHSFRAADCTYQPYEGARRACVAPQVRQASNDNALQRDPRPTMRGATVPRRAPRYEELPADDEDMDDADAPMDDDDQGSIVIYQRPRWFR